ncbi:anti-anti-sigma factor [Niastella yeongjuensis]|uniref:Anti-anti-sigma factor n=1 Tax=Niastella yeongjuensis TaxID=354355 RepID=A0A1V9F5U8_9BACT|nr:STAS domain-containing protein [Niastella yeongjuensis]OQP53783.1 anti-anti-sigma factor [Niastella yeongjuensis]SEP29365.1 anti-anti-sigma factor [Niastella yeongjuensis]
MQFKFDTSEKFHAIQIKEPVLSANMTEDLDACLMPFLKQEVKNVVLNLQDIQNIDNAAGEHLVKIQQHYYEHNASFVICCMQKQVEKALDDAELLELLNIAPTESEAWDILHMEEIERELGDSI